MNRSLLISLSLCMFSLPFFVYAETSLDDIGANPGSDFYSRIDDRGDALTIRLVQTRVRQYGTFGPLGCGVSWLDKEPIDQILLDEVSIGRYDRIMTIATRKGSTVSLNTPEFSRITQCLSEKYATIIQHASISQDAIETVGTTGLYADGDTRNSDYDIISDIQRINTIVFKDQSRYTGVQNNTSAKIRDFIAGQKIAPLFGIQPGSPASTDAPSTTTPTPSGGSGGGPSWAASCSVGSTGSGDMFDSAFYTDLSTTIGGGRSSGGGVVYAPPSLAGTAPSGVLFAGDKEDFFHTPPCTDAFCIHINQIPTSTQVLGGWKNNSIESLLEKHIKMMQPISESDLSCNIMQRESFANNDSRKKFADQIGGGQIFLVKKNQQTRTYKTDDTPTTRDADLMAAYSCAMSEAGLVADKDLINGMNGKGYRLLTSMNLTNTTQTELPGGATPTQNLQGCYQIRMNQPKTAFESSMIPDLDELQAMTRSMTEILSHILDADTKLDTLGNCK